MKIIIGKIKSKINLLNVIVDKLTSIQHILTKIQESLGRIESRQLRSLDKLDLHNNEFQVFSQWGEDGIIQYLLDCITISKKIFVEFGVQDYTESNTRFLLVNNNWSGLIIDGSKKCIDFIKKDPIYWMYNLKAVHAFITKDNINSIITENGIKDEIGILSIDIDGNDYWIWKEINSVNPAIVIVEYNHRFGKDRAVTIPYDDSFVRSNAHYSMIYFGASLKALCSLGKEKGYAFVGCNSAGNNAFFVRKDLRPDCIQELSPEEGYVAGKFRESRDNKGNLIFLNTEEEQNILASFPLIEVE